MLTSAMVLVAVVAGCRPREDPAATTDQVGTDADVATTNETQLDASNGEAGDDAAPAPTAAVAPPEPDGRMFFDADTTGNFEIYVRLADGSIDQLTDDPEWDSWWVRPSPDRQSILYYRTPAGTHDRDFTVTELWRAGADGAEGRRIIEPGQHGWEQHGHAEWSPNGQQLAMFAGGQVNPQIWTTDAEGQAPTELTDDPGINVDPSWSPDGATIVYVGCPVRLCFQPLQEIYAIPAGGGERVRLVDDELRDQDPYVSPDGERVAFLTQSVEPFDGAPFGYWDIRTIPIDGGEPETLTSGDQVFSLPRYAGDGTIWTHRLVYGSNRAFDIVTIDPTSGAVTDIIASRASEEYPSP